MQKYDNYEVFLLDDCSDDNSLGQIPDEHSFIHKMSNPKRLGPLANIYGALQLLALNEDDIILMLDGDDYLLGRHAFQLINYYYEDGALVTFGQYIDTFGRLGHCGAYSKTEFQHLRQAAWKASHLKTFKYKIFSEFLAQDPQGNAFRDDKGDIYMYAADLALMFPLLEIAGYENIIYNENIVYCYRRYDNNEGISEMGSRLQRQVEMEIRGKPGFKCVF